jgi:copper chaperone CopZ
MLSHKLTTRIIIFIFILTLVSCSGNNKKVQKESANRDASVIEVTIGGMTCLGCEQTIQKNLGKLEGIKSVKASFTLGNAIIEYYPGNVDTAKMKAAITGVGYTVKKFTVNQPGDGSK